VVFYLVWKLKNQSAHPCCGFPRTQIAKHQRCFVMINFLIIEFWWEVD